MPLAILVNTMPGNIHIAAVWIFQQEALNFDLLGMWNHMGWPARVIAVLLLLMSAWSIGVMIDRSIAYSAARKQSRRFAPLVGGALREGKLDEAIRMAERSRKSHLARVVVLGLQEFGRHRGASASQAGRIDTSKRALERAEAIVHAELERGLSGLATIGSTAPFVGSWER